MLFDCVMRRLTPRQLAEIMASGPPRKRAPRPIRWQFPIAIENQYAQELEALAARWFDMVGQALLPALERIERPSTVEQQHETLLVDVAPRPDYFFRGDAEPEPDDLEPQPLPAMRARLLGSEYDAVQVEELLRSLRIGYEATQGAIPSIVATAMAGVDSFNAEQASRVFRSVLGVDIVAPSTGISPILEAAIQQRARLITRYTDDMIAKTERLVDEAVRTGMRASALANDIEALGKKSRGEAERIARDQIASANGELTKARQEQVGVTTYVWRTMNDERVRKDHAKLDGTIHRWDEPPIVDSRTGRRRNPGGDYQCRCYAEPDMTDIFLAAKKIRGDA